MHSDIAELNAPTLSDAVSLYEMDVESSSPEGYRAMQQGYGHLLSLWDFQAYRFFVEALKYDENSIMATSGLTLALSIGDRHLVPQAEMAIVRLRELLKGTTGTEFERDFGYAVMKLISRNQEGWVKALATLAERQDQGWKLPAILHAYYMRDGYTARGEPRLNQRKAIETLANFCEESPEDPASLVFFITAQMDEPNLDAAFIDNILTNARKLVFLYPQFPVYRKLLAYCELRAGDPFLAGESYELAYSLYAKMVEAEHISPRNCPDLVNTQLGRISALVLQQDFAQAKQATTRLLSSPVEEYDLPGISNSALLWEGGSFGLRIALMSEEEEMLIAEISEMEKKLEGESKESWPAHYHYFNSLVVYAKSRQVLLQQGKPDGLVSKIQLLKESNQELYNARQVAAQSNALPYWRRAMNLAYILDLELKARYEMAQEKPDRITFINLVTAAIDEQHFYAQLSPPLWLEPVQNLKAEYLLTTGDYKQALEVLDESYLKIPNHMKTLKHLEATLQKLERPEDEEQVAEVIENFNNKREKK